MSELRIAVTLPGEASLGTFEAGAMAALIVGVQAISARSRAVRVDVLTGASSGSLTAVLAARALLAGEDPVRPLRRAWVTEPSLEALLSRDTRAPLTLSRAREVASEALAQPFSEDPAVTARAQEGWIALEFALASLRGFTYEIPRSEPEREDRDRESLAATSYVDWARMALGRRNAGGFTPEWSEAVEAALASASHPVAFPPTSLDRARKRGRYAFNGVTNFPAADEPGATELWYADGGLVDRQPLGRCIARARQVDTDQPGDYARLVLVLRPESQRAPARDDLAWTEAGEPPTWRQTLSRAMRIVAAHSLHEDLREVQKTNTRLAQADLLEEFLVATLRQDPERRRAFLALAKEIEALREPWRRPGAERPDFAGLEPQPDPAGKDEQALRRLVAQAVRSVAGLDSKTRVTVDTVNADPALIAGGGLHQFGGFLAESLRANDFAVGYDRMQAWMERGLEANQVDAADARAAIDAVAARAATIPGWVGGVSTRRPVSWRSRRDIARAGLRAAWIGLRDQVRAGAGDNGS